MNKKLVEVFDNIKNIVATEQKGTSFYNSNFEVINFKYNKTTKTIHWAKIVKRPGKPLTVIEYTITYLKKNTILFWKGDLVLKSSDSEYKSIVNDFVADAEALEQHHKQVLNEIKNGEIILLKIGQIVQLKDGLSLMLRYFTHKRNYFLNPSQAVANVQVIIGDGTEEEINLKSRSLAGLSYPNDTITLKGYVFRIRAFSYDKYIEVLVSKK
ncbi:hypothetical protein [Psychroserpens sp. NJDZ02]|uniref:hypothetical protein n=1 Tax=Psychroserpens sp. NJDZ02 TaxID=2570561 RepID=UPI0010A83959|nr:hypothetical protein [Psychroserpens sp. NJDZ02]QCE43048.1 hypothetical protein E9099_17025 [Psychroserpens sp. NJDZ02]